VSVGWGIGRSHKAFRANETLKRKGERNCLALWCAGGPPEAPFSVSTITCRNHAAAPRAGLTRRQARMPGEAYLTAVSRDGVASCSGRLGQILQV